MIVQDTTKYFNKLESPHNDFDMYGQEIWYSEKNNLVVHVTPPSRRLVKFKLLENSVNYSEPNTSIKLLNMSTPWKYAVSIPVKNIENKYKFSGIPFMFFAAQNIFKSIDADDIQCYNPYYPNIEFAFGCDCCDDDNTYQYSCVGHGFKEYFNDSLNFPKLFDIENKYELFNKAYFFFNEFYSVYLDSTFNSEIEPNFDEVSRANKYFDSKNYYKSWFDPKWTPRGVTNDKFLSRNSIKISSFKYLINDINEGVLTAKF